MATSAEYKLGEYAFPRGWFAVGSSSEIGRKPVALRYFGQDLVAYRGESGRVVVLDAYCPHMGTHLASGPSTATSRSPTHMEGDNIRCPFHAWRFGPDGVCNHIPYHDGPIPPAARIKSWTVEEKYGVVFVWHDAEEQAPDYPLIDTQALIVPLGECHGGVEADDREAPRDIEDGLDDGLAYVRV